MSQIRSQQGPDFNAFYQQTLRGARSLGVPVHDCGPKAGVGRGNPYSSYQPYADFQKAATTSMEPVRQRSSRKPIREYLHDIGEHTGINSAVRWTAGNVANPVIRALGLSNKR